MKALLQRLVAYPATGIVDVQFFLLSGSDLCVCACVCVCVYLRVRACVFVRAFECECFVQSFNFLGVRFFLIALQQLQTYVMLY